MKGIYNKSPFYFLIQVAFLLFILLLGWFAAGTPAFPPENLILLFLTLLIGLIGTAYGLLAGLGTSLAVLFLFGSVLIWQALVSTDMFLSTQNILLWMVAFLAAAVISGLLHKRVASVLDENKEMNAKFDTLVAVDEATGFDNEKRFYFSLEEEFRRSKRSGLPFTLLWVRIKFFNEFQTLYGPKETAHLLGSVANILREYTRLTDGKYRIADDTFAVILTNTVQDNASIVIGKIENLLRVHTLANKKKEVTLTVEFGVSGYRDDAEDYMELILHAHDELDQYIQ